MWYSIFKFELAYRSKRTETYAFFFILFLLSIVGADFIFQGESLGMVKKNSPIMIARVMGIITGIFMILASMIMGVPVLRDFEYNMESLLFVNPIKKRDYLLGKFLGSFVVLLFVFSGMVFGLMLGEFMPWHNPQEYVSFNLEAYLHAFILISLPILFFGSCLFFISGALSKNLLVVYTQGIIFFVIFIITKSIKNEFLQAILDPFSLATISFITDSWTVIEKNSFLIPFQGVLVYNKVYWILFGILTLCIGYNKFHFNILKIKRVKKQELTNVISSNNTKKTIPIVVIQEGLRSKLKQLIQLSYFYFIYILKQKSFWAIIICGVLIIIINSISLGTLYGVDSYPTTYLIVEELQEMSLYFFIIILTFYSAELVWNERGLKINLICDATSVSGFTQLLAKYFGLLLIYIALSIVLIASAVLFQALSGYFNFEFQVYFYGFFIEVLPFLALYTVVAFLLQAICNQKFIGILMLVVFFVIVAALNIFGYDHPLIAFGGKFIGTYSDMNGYGHFLKPYLIIKTYWLVLGGILMILASLFMIRGVESNLANRFKKISNNISKTLLKFIVACLALFIGLGAYIFHNTNVLNTYFTQGEGAAFRVAYERDLKQFEYISQPKITEVNLKVELYPSERKYITEGYYMLKNETKEPIKEVHVQKQIEENIILEDIIFDGGATANEEYNRYSYVIYTLKQPLLSGNEIKMNFKQTFIPKGFKSSVNNTAIVENGTFFNNKDFPTLGYNRKYEINDIEDRVDYNLPIRYNKPRSEEALKNARNGSDSNGIQFEMVIGTDINQTAVAPGLLVNNWQANNRNYFHYKTKQEIIDFYSIVSARYELRKEVWQSNVSTDFVNLEIYYHKNHDFNLERMMKSMKASLDYCSRSFSPYQYNYLRIMEFPRYAEFAQSFPGTISFSEGLGFVLDIDEEKDVDMVFFITAHEIAHQWFGMQLEAANVPGQLFILETLSQYAALMILKENYPEEKIEQLLNFEKYRHNEGIRKSEIPVPSLALVENEDYVYYSKGILNMYALQKAIGEDKVNLAIKHFINDWNTTNGKLKITTERYATAKDLLEYFREVTPKNQQQIIEELFKEN